MLRNADAASPLEAFARPRFETLLRDREVHEARRLLLASGKILHELRAERKRRHITDIAILGLEQIYPFPEAELEAELARYASAREVLWVQEEPANMGAFSFVDPLLDHAARGTQRALRQALRLRLPGHRLGQGPRPRAEDPDPARLRLDEPARRSRPLPGAGTGAGRAPPERPASGAATAALQGPKPRPHQPPPSTCRL